MTRAEAIEYLRTRGPHYVVHAILVAADPFCASLTVEWYARQMQKPDWTLTESLLQRSTAGYARLMGEMLDAGFRLRIEREDLPDLLASDIADVRMLAIRLMGRQDGEE